MKGLLWSLGLTMLLVAGTPAAVAGEETAATLAGILANMNHFPSESEKETLTAIAADESVDADLRAIARAIAGIEHTPSAADQAQLNGILANDAATAAEKTLARAVLRFQHKASVEDQAALQNLLR